IPATSPSRACPCPLRHWATPESAASACASTTAVPRPLASSSSAASRSARRSSCGGTSSAVTRTRSPASARSGRRRATASVASRATWATAALARTATAWDGSRPPPCRTSACAPGRTHRRSSRRTTDRTSGRPTTEEQTMTDQQLTDKTGAIVTVEHDDARGAYALTFANGEVAGRTFHTPTSDDEWIFFHTEVDDEYSGRGLGGILVGQAMTDVARQGRT